MNDISNDLALFTLSPKYVPGTDYMSRFLLRDQRVMEIVIKSIIGEHASSFLYSLGSCEWPNKSISDVLYIPKAESLAPILVEVQREVNDEFMSRAITYCLSFKKEYGQPAILLIFAIKAITDDVKLKFTNLNHDPDYL